MTVKLFLTGSRHNDRCCYRQFTKLKGKRNWFSGSPIGVTYSRGNIDLKDSGKVEESVNECSVSMLNRKTAQN